jgi:hypothetical protein
MPTPFSMMAGGSHSPQTSLDTSRDRRYNIEMDTSSLMEIQISPTRKLSKRNFAK